MEKRTSHISSRIQAQLENDKEDAALCNPILSSPTVFQVSYYMDKLTVDLEARSNTCRKWNLTGTLCCHAVTCIFLCNFNAEEYVSEWYKRYIP